MDAKEKSTATDIKKTAAELAEAGKEKVEKTGSAVKKAAEKATESVKKTAEKVTDSAKKTAEIASESAKKTQESAKKVSDAAKKTAEKATAAAKKTAAKATAAKKDVAKSAVFQDNYGNEKTLDDMYAAAVADFKEKNKRVTLKNIKIYVKAADNKIYYSANDGAAVGDVNLF